MRIPSVAVGSKCKSWYRNGVDGVEVRDLSAGNEEYRHGGYRGVSEDIPRALQLDPSKKPS